MAQKLARIFSGIQPTGIPHLGNYYGALQQWVEIAKTRQIRAMVETGQQSKLDANQEQNQCNNEVKIQESKQQQQQQLTNVVLNCDKPIYSIVDVHAYTSKAAQFGRQLYENILDTTASLLALGLTPENCILFRQSDVLEHYYLETVLNNFATTQRLSRMIQYKEKIADMGKGNKGISNGLLTYPVLQAADILLYKSTHVPVGQDQMQHIGLTRELARKFNSIIICGDILPEPLAVMSAFEEGRRVKSLRDPSKKMSKSDVDKRAFVQIVDQPEVIVERMKKAITDMESRVYYDAERRLGVSNLMRIHHLATGKSYTQIELSAVGLTSAQYKLQLADILIEKFRPVREEYQRLRHDRSHLEKILSLGQEQAQLIAAKTVIEVKQALGSME